MAAKDNPTSNWQPIGQLPVIAHHIDGMLEAAEEQYETLQRVRPKPHVLDNSTVGRVREVFTAQQQDLWLFDEQLRRWKAGTCTSTQGKEIARLVGQMQRLHEVIAAILRLSDELKERTIEKVIAKSDLELGLEFLLQGWQNEPPRKKP